MANKESIVKECTISRRDYFAAMAMQGMLANSYADGTKGVLSYATDGEIATMAVDQADALILMLAEED